MKKKTVLLSFIIIVMMFLYLFYCIKIKSSQVYEEKTWKDCIDESKLLHETAIQNKINDSIKIASLDTICRKEKDFYLKIHKLENDFLKLDYKLKNEKKEHSFKMRYFEASDNIFPMNGVGHLDSKHLKLEKYFIYKDSILILPILNIPNELSLYLIDLKNEENLVGYFKTSLLFFWIRTKNGLEIISAKPVVNDYAYSTYKYTLIKSRFKSGSLYDVKVDSITLKYNINDSIRNQYDIIKRF